MKRIDQIELVNKILNNETFKSHMQSIKMSEKERRFCLHGIEHSLDVARIAYIIVLENKLDITKEVIYASALLHDVGRATEYQNALPHHEQSASAAIEILSECGCDKDMIDLICEAIESHKHVDEGEMDLKYVLYKADKLSRNCFSCDVYDECYWAEDIKNSKITL